MQLRDGVFGLLKFGVDDLSYFELYLSDGFDKLRFSIGFSSTDF